MMLANTNIVARRAAVAAPRSATPVLPRKLVVRKFKVSLLLQHLVHPYAQIERALVPIQRLHASR
jgi:hypothetical protein